MQACLNEHAFCKKIALCVHISSTWLVQTLFALTGKNGQNLRAWTTVLTTKFRSWNFLPSRKNDRRAREPNFPLKLTRFKAFISFHCFLAFAFPVRKAGNHMQNMRNLQYYKQERHALLYIGNSYSRHFFLIITLVKINTAQFKLA